ncbi:IclR family transcriptional regulator [Citricoccus zhacaiensis]|uniref:IclR family transcriptional regulator n=1 Tax=Citricoccus zhacaiensis TaxID=489142 RepID=UPI0016695BF0|nr:IclR family transcriptional regulator [Citricoccus zhacaiensis]
MSTAISRGLGILQMLTGLPEGLALKEIATRLDVVKSSAHRAVSELVDLGYVRQDQDTGKYILGLKLISLAQRHLATIPLVDLAQSFLDRLSATSGELSRLSIVDESTLVWVAKREGSKSGLRFDPDDGQEVKLSCSASGLAWLSTMSDERALELVELQGYPAPDEYTPIAPRTHAEYLALLHEARDLGFGYVADLFEVGVAAIAVPVILRPGEEAVGVLNLCGPSARLDRDRCIAMLPDLRQAAKELATVFRDEHVRESTLKRHRFGSVDA